MKSFLITGNVILCGFISLLISWFFAKGAIGENYSNQLFVAPEFFLTLAIWFVGALLVWRYFTKNSPRDVAMVKMITINISIWLTIPIGYTISIISL